MYQPKVRPVALDKHRVLKRESQVQSVEIGESISAGGHSWPVTRLMNQ